MDGMIIKKKTMRKVQYNYDDVLESIPKKYKDIYKFLQDNLEIVYNRPDRNWYNDKGSISLCLCGSEINHIDLKDVFDDNHIQAY